MDTFLAIASKRDQRRYSPRPLPDGVVQRILDAGRLAGISQNRQDRELLVVESRREELAEAVFAPGNVRGAALVVAIVCPRAFDTGRAAQNMMLAAWNEGVTSCPNGVRDAEAAERALGAKPSIVLSFGYPEPPRDPSRRPAEEWSARARRQPLDEVTRRI